MGKGDETRCFPWILFPDPYSLPPDACTCLDTPGG
jgi:hypothetical protein